jgi:hypothetical protein
MAITLTAAVGLPLAAAVAVIAAGGWSVVGFVAPHGRHRDPAGRPPAAAIPSAPLLNLVAYMRHPGRYDPSLEFHERLATRVMGVILAPP